MATVLYDLWVKRIRADGEVHLPVGELPAELAEFRRELRRAGRAAGVRILTSARDGLFLAWDPDFVVPPERMRAVADALAKLDGDR